MMLYCSHCVQNTGTREADGYVSCDVCGKIIADVADPCLYIRRFTEQLLGREDDEVSIAALRIVAGAENRERIRDPKLASRICAAALYVAAVGRGYAVSKSEVANAVEVCEASLEKQSVDFGDTW